jgi:hypothetical protein
MNEIITELDPVPTTGSARSGSLEARRRRTTVRPAGRALSVKLLKHAESGLAIIESPSAVKPWQPRIARWRDEMIELVAPLNGDPWVTCGVVEPDAGASNTAGSVGRHEERAAR